MGVGVRGWAGWHRSSMYNCMFWYARYGVLEVHQFRSMTPNHTTLPAVPELRRALHRVSSLFILSLRPNALLCHAEYEREMKSEEDVET